MNDLIIGPPPESRWGHIRGVFGKIHPTIWAAIVAGVFGLVGLWLGSCLQSGKLQNQVDTLLGQVSERDKTIQEKNAKIQELQTLLVPFKTIAIEKFTGDEKDVLRKLGDYIVDLQTKDAERSKRIGELNERARSLEKEADTARLELERVKNSQEPRVLSQKDSDVLSELLKDGKSSHVTVVSIMGDLEAIRLANQYKNVFEKAGWSVSGVEQKIDSSGQAFGIIVCVNDISNPPPQARLIQEALASLAIQCGYSNNKEVAVGDVWFVAGSKY